MKVSVIIPVYNVGKYIKRCAHSLFSQTLNELEYIFVDDCSPDNSIDIVKEVLNDYPHRQQNVRIIRHDVNYGVSKSRQDGVDVATGKYIIHCDPDDWIEPDMYEQMLKKAISTDADIIGCDYIEFFKDRSVYHCQQFNLKRGAILTEMLNIKPTKVGLYLWNRLIKRSYIEQCNVQFLHGVTLWEDVAYLIPLHFCGGKVEYIAKALYHYNRTNQDSAVTVFRQSHALSLLRVGKYLRTYFETKELSTSQRLNLENRLLRCKLPLITESVAFDANLWRHTWPGLQIHYYPSLKMKIIMYLAILRMDAILKFICS